VAFGGDVGVGRFLPQNIVFARLRVAILRNRCGHILQKRLTRQWYDNE